MLPGPRVSPALPAGPAVRRALDKLAQSAVSQIRSPSRRLQSSSVRNARRIPNSILACVDCTYIRGRNSTCANTDLGSDPVVGSTRTSAAETISTSWKLCARESNSVRGFATRRDFTGVAGTMNWRASSCRTRSIMPTMSSATESSSRVRSSSLRPRNSTKKLWYIA